MQYDITFHSQQPIYTQLADYLRKNIALGELRSGERLLPIRDLATQLKIDPGTVARAYRQLEREGVVITRAGGGTAVSRSDNKDLAGTFRQKLDQVVDRAVLEAFGLGFTTDDVETAFIMRLADWREKRVHPEARTKTPGRTKEIKFMGSHDLSVQLLARHLNIVYPNIKFSPTFVGSLAGLVAVASHEADIAGCHLIDFETGQFNIPFVKRLMPTKTVVVINLVKRIQGLMVAPGNPKHILNIEDLAQPGIVFVNRQEGSGTRTLLDSWLIKMGIKASQVRGYEREEITHMAVATLIAQGKADVGLGVQSAASVTGLHFIPLARERYDLVMLKETFDSPVMRKLRKIVDNAEFKHMLDSIPGCDASETGLITVVEPDK